MHYSGDCTVYSVKHCERLDLGSQNLAWEALPDMKEGRWSFNPCLFNEYVYLCGCLSKLIEAFSPLTESFLPLPLPLPESSPSCLYVHKNSLVVHTKNYVSKFSAGLAGQLIPHSPVRCPAPVSKSSNSHPVLDPTRCLFFLFRRERCINFNVETGALVEIFSELPKIS